MIEATGRGLEAVDTAVYGKKEGEPKPNLITKAGAKVRKPYEEMGQRQERLYQENYPMRYRQIQEASEKHKVTFDRAIWEGADVASNLISFALMGAGLFGGISYCNKGGRSSKENCSFLES